MLVERGQQRASRMKRKANNQRYKEGGKQRKAAEAEAPAVEEAAPQEAEAGVEAGAEEAPAGVA